MECFDIIQEMEQNFIEYAAAVNTDRAIPDARTGLKPVQLRIIYGAHSHGYYNAKAHVKCARIVGDVMGELHPHGDSSIYGAMVRMAQWWVLRYPLLDFHGNMGNQGGDGPAAYRYTEARLSKLVEQGMLKGIKTKNVDFVPNYDDTLEEPDSLPAIFPNLLCNPSKGIGVGVACNWLPHNLKEVADAIFAYINGEEPVIAGPDFPTGGEIINADDCKDFIAKGKGTVRLRGRYEIETKGKKNQIVFYEIPYGLTIEGLIEEIGKAADAGEIQNITDVHDETNKKNVRLVIQVAKGTEPEAIIPALFAKTNLQTTISYNQVALVGKTPTELGLKDCIKIYLEHNEECIRREFAFELKEAQDRKEIVDGILKALVHIDDIIALIKKSDSGADARERLQKTYGFTERQAKAITAMRLSSLAKLEKIEYEKEAAELDEKIKDYTNICESHDRRISIIVDRLTAIVNTFGDERRTILSNIAEPKKEKEIEQIIPEDVVVVVTPSGMIKRVPKKSFKPQHKNGKGIKNSDTAGSFSLSTSTVDYVLIFTDAGKMYKLLVDKIPEGTSASKGAPLNTLLKIDPSEKIMTVTTLDTKKKYIVFFTKKGMIKKSKLEEYLSTKKSTGIAAIKLKEGDAIANIEIMDEEEVIIITKNGMSIRFKTEGISPIGRVAMGVKGVNLNEGDELFRGIPIESGKHLAIFCNNGLGKRVKIEDFSEQNRGGKGVQIISQKDNLQIVGAALVGEDDSVYVAGRPNSITINCNEIPVMSRFAAGGSIIKNSQILTVTKL